MGAVVILIGAIALQAASGAVWWAFARRAMRISAVELIGMGLALGTFASMLSAMVLAGTALDRVAWALPALVTATAVVVAVTRRRLSLAAVTLPGEQVLAVVVGLLASVMLLAGNWVRVPLDRPATPSYTDLFFFEALSRGLAEFGPAQSILMSGGSLRYHWFTYAWAGELAQTASAPPFATITRVLPLVTLVGVAMLAAAWAGRLSRVRWAPTLAVLLVTAGGYAGALYGSILNFDSPSQSMTTLWLMALSIAFLALVDGLASRRTTLTLIVVLSTACTGGKVSHAVVAASGMAVVLAIGILSRASWRKDALLGTIAAAAAMSVTYLVVLAGVALDRNLTEDLAVKASTWQGLDPMVGRLGVWLGTVALVLAILSRLAGLGWLLALARTRTRPDTLFTSGAVASGIIAMLLLSEGVNELWFVLAASAPAAVLSAVGVGRALRAVARPPVLLPRPLLWAVVVAIPASLTCLALSANWGQHRAVLNWLAPVSVWILVPVASLIVVAARPPTRGRLVLLLALTVGGLALTSIATRPAALWTSSRPITTERGGIAPQPGLPGEAGLAGDQSVVVEPTDTYTLAASAARWLVDHSAATDTVATTTPLSAVIPALTGRQMFLAGDIYQVGLGRADELATIEDRQKVSLGIADGIDQAEAASLCAAGVRWIWVDGPPDAATALGLDIGYANEAASVLRYPAEACEAG